MRFTSQEEYGLRCLLQLARDPGDMLTIPEIASREGLTQAYVAKLLRLLRKGGLLESIRGQKGGYRLARLPEEISLASVLATLGGRLYSRAFCGRFPGVGRTCVHDDDCSIRSVWSAVDHLVHRALGTTMLADLAHPEGAMGPWLESHMGPGSEAKVRLWPRQV